VAVLRRIRTLNNLSNKQQRTKSNPGGNVAALLTKRIRMIKSLSKKWQTILRNHGERRRRRRTKWNSKTSSKKRNLNHAKEVTDRLNKPNSLNRSQKKLGRLLAKSANAKRQNPNPNLMSKSQRRRNRKSDEAHETP
jgi:hypothetical protein